MIKRFIFSIVSIFSFVVLYATELRVNQCEVFWPEILKQELIKESEVLQLAKSKTYGQDSKLEKDKKTYWDVYSDRENNKVYGEPRLNSLPSSIKLRLGEKLRIAKIENGFALVYQEKKGHLTWPLISDEAIFMGWVPMDNLLLWNHCPTDDKGIYKKALIVFNMDAMNRDTENEGKLYKNPDNKIGEYVETGMTFYYIMKKRSDGRVLLAREANIERMVGDPLLGWVDYETYIPWNQRSCIEPNWKVNIVENKLKGASVSIMDRGSSILSFGFGNRTYKNHSERDKYRIPTTVLRYPILEISDDSIKCTAFGLTRGEVALEDAAENIDETRKEEEKHLEKMSHLNLIIVIDGTQSMKPYFAAVKEAIKNGCESLGLNSEQNKYQAKVGLVIYRDYTDGNAVTEFLPISDVNDPLLMEYLDKGGDYGVQSAKADRTREEALYKGLEVALDNIKMGYEKDESNLMLVVGDCGNDENDSQCLTRDEIVDKLVENNISLMTFQVRRENGDAWNSFTKQMGYFQLNNAKRQYDKLNAVKDVKVKVEWVPSTDGLDIKTLGYNQQFFIASLRQSPNYGVAMPTSKLASLMEHSISDFAYAIGQQRAAVSNYARSTASDENAKLNEAYVIARFGREKAERLKSIKSFVALTGTTPIRSSNGTEYWNNVLFISDREFDQLLQTLQPVYRHAKKCDRKLYISGLKGIVQGMLPDIENMDNMSTGDIMNLITGLNAKSRSLNGYTLGELGDPKAVSEKDFINLVTEFADKYVDLDNIRKKPNYPFIHKSDENTYYWIPVEQLP